MPRVRVRPLVVVVVTAWCLLHVAAQDPGAATSGISNEGGPPPTAPSAEGAGGEGGENWGTGKGGEDGTGGGEGDGGQDGGGGEDGGGGGGGVDGGGGIDGGEGYGGEDMGGEAEGGGGDGGGTGGEQVNEGSNAGVNGTGEGSGQPEANVAEGEAGEGEGGGEGEETGGGEGGDEANAGGGETSEGGDAGGGEGDGTGGTEIGGTGIGGGGNGTQGIGGGTGEGEGVGDGGGGDTEAGGAGGNGGEGEVGIGGGGETSGGGDGEGDKVEGGGGDTESNGGNGGEGTSGTGGGEGEGNGEGEGEGNGEGEGEGEGNGEGEGEGNGEGEGTGGDGEGGNAGAAQNNTQISITTPRPPATTERTPCGMHAKVEGEECVCDLGWIRDPADPSSLCVCPDLCHEGSVSCPGQTECYHVTCNIASCRCKDGLHYDPSSRTCLNTCQYYGDAVCGLTSRRYCIGSDEDATTYACRCMDGYDVVDGECQDADECKGGPCKEKETCINTPGSYKCVCQSGYMRNHDGLCANVNECASPSLHDCEHVCEDAEPPLRFSCTCYPGYTWQAFTRSCVIDDELTKCDCEDDNKSVCYQPRDGEKQCHPRPGYALVNGTFQDEAECDSEERLSSWCGVSSECVDGEGTATCNCLSGYANDTINYGQCEAVVCPAGTVLSDSACVEPCDTIQCAPPLRCGVTSEGVPECRCLSECQALLEPEVTSSVYRGVVEVLALSGDSVTAMRLTKALGTIFGADNTEILSVTPAANRRSATTRSDATTAYRVDFLVMALRPNMTGEVNQALRGQCMNSTDTPSTCVLPGGLVVERESMAVKVKDPCEDSPCPEGVSECVPRDDVSGRYTCRCLKGYVKVNSFGSFGFCREVDECAEGLAMCRDDQECINTPGGFLCRSLTGSAASGDFHRDLAIAFGVLFFLTLLLVMCLVYRSAKKSPRVHECLPMNSTATGFENAAFHK